MRTWEEEDIEKDTGEKEEGTEYYHMLNIIVYFGGKLQRREGILSGLLVKAILLIGEVI